MAAFFINEDNDDHFTGLSEMVCKSQPDTPCVKAFTSQDFGDHSLQVFYFTAKEVETRRVTSKVKKKQNAAFCTCFSASDRYQLWKQFSLLSDLVPCGKPQLENGLHGVHL